MQLTEFFQLASGLLLPGDFKELENFHIEDPARAFRLVRKKSAGQYLVFDITLRNHLARLRAARLKTDTEKYSRTGTVETRALEAASRIFEEKDPARSHDALLLARFEMLSDLESGHQFDLAVVLLYSMKLKIAWERSAFNDQQGREIYFKELARVFKTI